MIAALVALIQATLAIGFEELSPFAQNKLWFKKVSKQKTSCSSNNAREALISLDFLMRYSNIASLL